MCTVNTAPPILIHLLGIVLVLGASAGAVRRCSGLSGQCGVGGVQPPPHGTCVYPLPSFSIPFLLS
jgi:hypothetical protein